jgi:hypothetical protein
LVNVVERGQHRQLRIGASTHAPILFDPGQEREHSQPNFSTLLVGYDPGT